MTEMGRQRWDILVVSRSSAEMFFNLGKCFHVVSETVLLANYSLRISNNNQQVFIYTYSAYILLQALQRNLVILTLLPHCSALWEALREEGALEQ